MLRSPSAFLPMLVAVVVPSPVVATPYQVAGVKLEVTAAPEKSEIMLGEPCRVSFKGMGPAFLLWAKDLLPQRNTCCALAILAVATANAEKRSKRADPRTPVVAHGGMIFYRHSQLIPKRYGEPP